MVYALNGVGSPRRKFHRLSSCKCFICWFPAPFKIQLIQWYQPWPNFFWQRRQWIRTILPWCNYGGRLKKWSSRWILRRNNFIQNGWWHCHFSTHAESYHHRGPPFANYSQLEFECIVHLPEKTSLKMNCDEKRGSKSRPSFQLGSSHPLYASHVGVIRIKMCTPMLAGAPPPQFPGNQPIDNESLISKWNTNMKYYATCLMDLCVP